MYCIETWVPAGLLLPSWQASVLVQGPETRGRLGSGGLPASLAASHIAFCQGEKKGMSACFFWGFPAQKIYCSLRLAPTNSWILLLCPFAFHSWSCSHFKALKKTYWHCRKGDKLASWAALTTKLPDFVMVFFLNWCQKLKDKFA